MRHLSLRGGALLALLACPLTLAHAAGSLEERMSYKEFTAYGLDKLSPEQLQGLNQWVQQHAAECATTTAPVAGGAVPAPATTAAAASSTIHSRLAGKFKGWEKGTVLTLENGQRWEVRDDEPVIGSGQDSPMVSVERGLVSGWRLSIDGASDVAHVVPAQSANH